MKPNKSDRPRHQSDRPRHQSDRPRHQSDRVRATSPTSARAAKIRVDKLARRCSPNAAILVLGFTSFNPTYKPDYCFFMLLLFHHKPTPAASARSNSNCFSQPEVPNFLKVQVILLSSSGIKSIVSVKLSANSIAPKHIICKKR
ncbi:MAG: hypothetical protein MUE44_23635 [Oscillatoriaceae cyanobacterium Prado104]|nr:hypothetical protein [Oscillatoriaceae cyanobacterium Prado104]